MAERKKSSLSLLVLSFALLQLLLFLNVRAIAPAPVTQEAAEAQALLTWKASLENHSLLNSWSLLNNSNATSTESKRNSTCNWLGITCNVAGRITRINLFNASLRGKLDNLSFSSFSELAILNLSSNALHGTIPAHIGTLTKLNILDLSVNQFFGYLPLSLGNLTKLTTLYIYENNISGSIPQEIGYLKNLIDLELSKNLLTGTIPHTLGNLTKLTTLYIDENSISGTIPHEVGHLKNLIKLSLSINLLTGIIPPTLGNLTKLTTLYIYKNNISGSIPQEIGHLKNLIDLELSTNLLTELYNMRLENNYLTGNISNVFGHYPNLIYMDLSYNDLYGELSPKWGECQSLQKLQLSGNKITGKIPPEFGKLSQLQVISFSSNKLAGEIPKEMGRLSALYSLSLNDNELSGNIPLEIGMLSNVSVFDLSMNDLSGHIPKELMSCFKLLSLNLSRNNFIGSIPFQIETLSYLGNLDHSHNSLNKEIPSQFGNLKMLENLNLSHNMLLGHIPSSFEEISSLTSIDISNNNLEGPIPRNKAFQQAPFEALSHNKGLCGNASGLQTCNSTFIDKGQLKKVSKVVIINTLYISGLFFILLACIVIFFFLKRRARHTAIELQEMSKGDAFSIWNFDGRIVYNDIIQATENFDSKYCIGVGGYGSVYKAELSTGQVVAVKRLHPLEGGSTHDQKSFNNEIKALTEIRHRNIVKLYGFCSHEQCMFSIYEYMERSKLAGILSCEEALELDWIKRVNVVKGVASALSYMHHDCFPPIVHRDISSNNILLDSELEACISDFGTSRLLKPDSSNWSSLAGTYGYVAPVLMGKHPGDLIHTLHFSTGQNILLKDVLDQRLSPPSAQTADEVISVAVVALVCIRANPQSRPNMRNVSQKLSSHRLCTLEPFQTIILCQLNDLDI
ncbi:MDIS1-interacting receptor like kinase 2-like protein [Cinnamomum micranthum f. kanehirae]|uniref:non-specific serine/threonine protein kinase n=1 Tax=Cinnamomum micranthum f. kanehirae TaxID=337451 RepID=A0A3S3NS45_9MAGN|nr:MDIS1-interacting receptor like kinase 2-like protein [Cinnamomum micranthum f. kanehirae]